VLSDTTIRRLCADFGARVRTVREKAGLTPKELAGFVGLSRSSIANLEAGRQRVPIHIVWCLADALGVSVAELLPEGRIARPGAKPQVNRVLKQEPRLGDVSPASKRRVREFIETKFAQTAAEPSTAGPSTKEG
jgi:transcriptional regulator with XRE-family HTH domain